jgi:diaminohydroxyphosphoribosylaminopyrimidine deaminase/5-amino-6-(5-phosphoribosylamino)uracil reductase
LLLPFTKWQKDNFIFFKMAMRKDGSINNGYITTQDSLNLVHEIRTKLSLMVIGGNTVRIDRPTLDSRFSKSKKTSDILIYSANNNFDKTIALFNIENRKVEVSNNLNNLDKNNFIMVEGGYDLLKSVKNKIDCLLLFISNKQKEQSNFDIKSLGFKKIYSYMINEFDEVIFLYK